MTLLLEFECVSVSRGDLVLFEDLSIQVFSGDVVWIQGTNGVGKTTLLHLAAGLARPDSGALKWYKDKHSMTAFSTVGFQGHQDALKASITVMEDLQYWGDLAEYTGDIDRICTRIGLSERKNIAAGKLSAGQKRRLALGRLLVSQKPIWVMDEPSAVMDAVGTELIDGLVKEHVKQGGAAIIASHSPARKVGIATRLLTLSAA